MDQSYSRLVLINLLFILKFGPTLASESSEHISSPENIETVTIEYGEGTTDRSFDKTTTIDYAYASVEDLTTVSVITPEEEYLESVRRPVRNCGCGVRKLKYVEVTRVIGGQPASEGEFPWFAAISKFQHNKHPRWKIVCGAALINGEFAITAAHCLHNRFKDTLEVVFNVKDVNNITTDPNVTHRKIKQFIIHPDYNPKTQDNDVALIQFKLPISLQTEKSIVPICLPRTVSSNIPEKVGTFVGFGHTSYGSGSPGPKENSRVLMKVDLPILSHVECLRSKVPTKKNVTESMVCAGGQKRDACINDSGGPLMTQSNDRTVLIGLASWGIGCGLPDYPGVYTRVSKYLDWIKLTASFAGSSDGCF